jgi:hypothetical protein
MTDKAQKTAAPAKEVRKGAVQPEKPTRLPNVGQPRPVSTTGAPATEADKTTAVKKP